MKNYRDILYEQLAADYCCRPEDVADTKNHFSTYQPLEGRRKWQNQKDCYLKIAVINGKLLFSGRPDIIDWCEEQYADSESAWFFEMNTLQKINERICKDGYQIGSVHPFFLPDNENEIEQSGSGYDICWYEEQEIEQFRGNACYKNAYSFCPEAPDVIGVAALQDGVILGMAGASCDSPSMWQIGIDVDKHVRQHGIGGLLVSLLKNEILRRGALPFYGTAMSHIASQKVALRAGFLPAWAELSTSER
ncbi:MAG: GNAT family N-acetyltransferase [Parasporobacterium sp.]|nr:GNAT family N-acetyltransferase [Parasporobacterium sp.]